MSRHARRRSAVRVYGTWLAAAAFGLCATACSSIGPATVVHDRIDYASSIGSSWKEQTLLNIVKLRYADVPIFLEVAQIVAGYQVQGTLGANFNAANFNAAQIGPFVAGGSLATAGTYTDRPTVVYSPLTGTDFLKRLMTPIPPSSVMFLLQAGYAAERTMPIMLTSINGLNNASNRLRRAADPRFARLVRLLGEGQRDDAIQIRIERSKEGGETSVIFFPPKARPDLLAKGQEVRRLLGLRPDLHELKIFYGGHSGRDDEIDMKTRSMLEIMLEFAGNVQVPESDVAGGRTTPGVSQAQPDDAGAGPGMRILSGDAAPRDVFVAVRYSNRWYWIADTDLQSKSTFTIVMLLFSIADTGVKGAAPVVTIPASP